MKMARFAGVGLAALLIAGAALAQDMPPPPPGGPDGADGPPRGMGRALDKAEMQAMTDRRFDRLDTDHDGVISKAEFDAMRGPPPPPGGPEGGPGDPGGPGRRGPASRGPGMMMMGPGWFDHADANHDGVVSKAEADAVTAHMFDMMDTNHDGQISAEERRAAMAMMREHGAPPPPPPPPPQG